MELPETLRPHFRPVPSRYDFLDVDFEVRGREGERARGREGESEQAREGARNDSYDFLDVDFEVLRASSP